MLTNATVKAARPGARPYKMADAGGLHLLVMPNGRKTWRMKFRLDRREKLLTFGGYPEVGLGHAREQRDEARAQIRRGEDPSGARRRAIEAAAAAEHAQAAARTFEDVARNWHAGQLARWSDVHAGDVLVSLERDVFPAIGAMPVAGITVPVVLNALRSVERRGRIETARRIRQRISAVFAFAIGEGHASHDPAAIVAKALAPARLRKPQPALLKILEARELLAAAELVDAAAVTKLASRFLALTTVRLAALRGARWPEIEDLDGPEPLWRVPAVRMKLTKARKAEPGAEHVVPLSKQAVAVLVAASANTDSHANTVSGGLIFPGRSGRRRIGDGAIGELYDRAGYAGRHVPHGWRASFSTIMNELEPENGELIDRALGHAPKDKVKAAYDRAKHLARRRELLQRWADHLVDR